MKYDSSMTHFNKDIIAALQYMLKDDSEITEKFSHENGSPAPLRDYLKQKYGKSCASHIGGGMRYSCNATKGLELTSDTILNNPGDKNLTLSWSQVTKFIRDNWDEVFNKAESAAPQTETVLPKVGDYVEEEMLGDLLSFDELTEMVGQLVVNDYSTESKNWYKVVRIDKIYTNVVDDSRSVLLIRGPKKNDIGRIDEYAFNIKGTHTLGDKEVPRAHRMWRLKQEPVKNQPSYIDKLREKYPKVNETDKWFNKSYCPADLFDGENVNEYNDDKCNYTNRIDDFESCKKCWGSQCPADIFFVDDLDDFEEEYFENYPAEADAGGNVPKEKTICDDCINTENQIIPQNAGEISETFNYAVLSAEMGDFLKRKEQQLKNEYMNFTANCGAIFAEVQEKLAKDGHGTFIKWIEAMGFKKDTVYRMIDVNKFRLSLIAKDGNGTQEIFDALPKYLQYDISKPSAPAELVEQVLNGDITTHKDYIALKKQLEYTKAACDHANKRRDENYSQYQDEHRKNVELEKRVKELESRPIDVAVQQDETSLAEIDRLKNELAKAQQEILNASFGSSTADSELLTDLYETLHGSALSAIRSCADFAGKNGGRFTSRFRSLAEVINDCINEMEEF